MRLMSSPATCVIVPARSAKTPIGAISMMTSTSRMMTSLSPSTTSSTGLAFSRGIWISPIPMNSAMKTTCSMFAFSPIEAKMFSGTMSTRN